MGILFIESIKRLYRDEKITKDKIVELHKSKKITEEELNYIINVETNDVEEN